ncbi:hypothetical protein [Chthonobacter albigriseus]|uniref:hypothetical protein n=1 Tax=Chthonobacter albigriseus TaxID=1683161 RepID=UPI0015EF849F|nr:hypothetical protein [Chthonobacter albigriseus]
MALRFALPVVNGRGSGLGNEMIPWAKAIIAGQALRIPALPPAWGANKRAYWRYFRSNRLDFVAHRLLRAGLPYLEFRESDLLPGRSLHDSVLAFAAREGLGDRLAYVLGFDGLWGGFDILRDARLTLLQKLLSTRHTLDNLYALSRRLRPDALHVGVHIRRGDFGSAFDPADFRARFNTAIPMDWYIAVARRIAGHFGSRVQFVVGTDGTAADIEPFTREFDCVTTLEETHRDVSDLLVLARTDLMICSISSFSCWAVFLNDSRYVWLAENLTEMGGFRSIWGYEPGQQPPDGPTARARDTNARLVGTGETLVPRGVAVDWSGSVPDDLLADLEHRVRIRRRTTDLVLYGAIPATPSVAG